MDQLEDSLGVCECAYACVFACVCAGVSPGGICDTHAVAVNGALDVCPTFVSSICLRLTFCALTGPLWQYPVPL